MTPQTGVLSVGDRVRVLPAYDMDTHARTR